MSVFRKLAGQTAVYGLSSIVGRLLNYLLVPLYTRVFETGEYGIVTQLYAFVAFLNILFTYGMETAYFRYAREKEDGEKVYSTILISILISSLSFALIISLFSGSLSGLIGLNSADPAQISRYIIWFAAILSLDAITVIPFARLRMENKAARFVMIRLTSIATNIGLNLFFLLLCPYLAKQPSPPQWLDLVYHPGNGIAYVFLANLISSVLPLMFFLPQFFRIRWKFDTKLWKQMLRYSFPLMIAGFAGMINETFDRLMLPILLKDPSIAMEQLGIYGACYKISVLMTLFVQTYRYAADPFFFAQAKTANAKETYSHAMNAFVMAGTFIFLAVMLFMDQVQLLIGEEFRAGLKVVPILLLANFFLGVYYNLSFWYKLSGKTQWGAWLSLLGAGITLLFNFLLIPVLGYMGAAWATLICYSLMMLLSYFIGQRYYPIPYNVRPFIHYLLSAIIVWQISEHFFRREDFSSTALILLNSGLLLVFVLTGLFFERRKNGYLRRP